MMITSIALYALFITLVLYSRREGTILSRIGFKEKINIKKETLISVTYFLLLILIAMSIGIILYQLGMQEDLSKAPDILRGIPITELLIVLLIGSFTEEVFFRGYLQDKTNIWVASFVFGFFHIVYGSLSEVLGAFFLGLALGHEYRKTKGVFAPILTHITYNLFVVSMVILA